MSITLAHYLFHISENRDILANRIDPYDGGNPSHCCLHPIHLGHILKSFDSKNLGEQMGIHITYKCSSMITMIADVLQKLHNPNC